MRTDWDDSNWREEYKAFTSDKKQLELLENGPKSLSQSWLLQALHQKWMKIKGYSFSEPPNSILFGLVHFSKLRSNHHAAACH